MLRFAVRVRCPHCSDELAFRVEAVDKADADEKISAWCGRVVLCRRDKARLRLSRDCFRRVEARD